MSFNPLPSIATSSSLLSVVLPLPVSVALPLPEAVSSFADEMVSKKKNLKIKNKAAILFMIDCKL